MVNGTETTINATTEALMNATNSSQQGTAVLGDLSWQATIILIVLILVVGSIVVAAVWKPRGRKQRTSNPFFKALFLTFLFTIAILVTEGMGWFGDGGMPLWLKIVLLLLLFVGLLNWFKSEDKLLQERVTNTYPERIRAHQRGVYDAELNVGDSPGSQIPHSRVLPNMGYGGGDVDVVHYLVMNNMNRFFMYAYGLRSGVMVDCVEDPSPEQVQKVFKRVPKSVLLQIQQAKIAEDSAQRLRIPGPQHVAGTASPT